MFDLNVLDLSRFQFAFTISFHIIFPALSIGLASFLMVTEALWLRTGDGTYRAVYRYWVRLFAITFGLGVVSGVVMAYEFGTNWSGFSERAGDITGVLLTYEVLTAFFIEAGFLGIMLFGENRVSRRVHFFATTVVAIGTLLSTFWILSSNSWMHTPAGYEVVNGRFEPVNWWHVVFNPSFPYRLVHMGLAAMVSVGFLVAGVAGWHLLRDHRDRTARRMLSMAMWFVVLFMPIQIMAGDMHGLNTLEHQPAKVAAMEGYWENETSSGGGMPLALFALPDRSAATNHFELSIPHLDSLILTHSWTGRIQPLKAWPRDEWPEVSVIFWSFRLMVGLGLVMLAIALLGLYLRWRGRLYDTRWFQRLTLWVSPIGFVTIIAGWVTTEMGRQPWVVYGMMRTADAVSNHSLGTMITSLLGFLAVYAVIFSAGVYFFVRTVRQQSPDELMPEGGAGEQRQPRRPMSAADSEID